MPSNKIFALNLFSYAVGLPDDFINSLEKVNIDVSCIKNNFRE